jgi:hypothetical protein
MPQSFPYGFGWRKQSPDFRDLRFAPPVPTAGLPSNVDLTAQLGDVLNQGQMNSCGPNALEKILASARYRQGLPPRPESRLFIYYNTRLLMGQTAVDQGVDNRSLLKAVAKYGICGETLWPYNPAAWPQRPPDLAYVEGAKEVISSYAALRQDLATMKAALAAGFPFLFGFAVYESMLSAAVAASGDIPLPLRTETLQGGHDIVICGYDDGAKRFRFRNSWGADWGQGGNGTIPYEYATNGDLSADFWVVNAVPGAITPPKPPPPAPGQPAYATITDAGGKVLVRYAITSAAAG